MKLRSGHILRKVCGQTFVVMVGEENVDFSKVISLNESLVVLWERMEQGEFTVEDLVKVLMQEYEVDEATATQDVEAVLEDFRKEGLIE